jgi:hypothetical protein
MKRLITITSCFLLLFAVLTAAWASCKQISFVSDHDDSAPVPVHTHDHHSGTHDDHSQHPLIHCDSIDEFVPVTPFSGSNDHRGQHLLTTFVAELGCQFTEPGFRSIHGPPAPDHLRIPQYLFLSALRI